MLYVTELQVWVSNKDEMINHIISEYSNPWQNENKSKLEWEIKEIHRELCKKLKFTILPNGIFPHQNRSLRMRRKKFSGISRYKKITKYRPAHKFIKQKKKKKNRKKENLLNCGVCHSSAGQSEKKSEMRDKYLDFARGRRKLSNMMTVISIVVGTIAKGTGKTKNQMTKQTHPDHSIIEMWQDTEKSPETLGNLRRHTVTQTPVNELQLM